MARDVSSLSRSSKVEIASQDLMRFSLEIETFDNINALSI
jgi:hypothetical protein